MAMLFDDKELQDRRIQTLLSTAVNLQQLKQQKDIAGVENELKRKELEMKIAENDPKNQALKLSQTLAMLGNAEAAERIFGYSGIGTQPTLPSQEPTQKIPNYLGVGGGVNSQTAGLSGGMGVLGANIKSGKNTIRLGQPGLNDIDKANLQVATDVAKKKQETVSGAEKTLSGTDRYLEQFERSYQELKAVDPDIDKRGAAGKISRAWSSVGNALDEYPETKALRAMAEPLAQQIATDIEGRATDEDRKIQARAFADVLKGPSEANARVASNSLLMLKDKGADISKVLKRLSKSNIDVIQKIVQQVYDGAPELKPGDVNIDDLFKGL